MNTIYLLIGIIGTAGILLIAGIVGYQVNLVFGQSALVNETSNATEKQRQLERDKYEKMIQEDIGKGGKIPKPCVIYESTALMVINLDCGGFQNSVIANYLSQGYEIKAATDTTIYLTKGVIK